MTGTSIWLKNGSKILSSKNINAELKNNKIYSLAWENYGNSCDFVEYETYMENGQVKQNKVKIFKDTEVDGAGEKC
jgi:hypothetical protein